MSEIKSIILCADDYGLNESISQAIRQLVTQRRLSAVGCMVNTDLFAEQAKKLKALDANIDIGLHFNLTQGQFLSQAKKTMPSLATLLATSQLRLLTLAKVEQELHVQLDEFIYAFGKMPDFIDGHQHVHHLPIIRKALLRVYQTRLSHQQVYLRSVYPTWVNNSYALKARILKLTGGYAFKRLLQEQAIPHNPHFLGIYDFIQADYRNLFSQFLAQARPGSLLMCHPGLSQNDSSDPIASARAREYAYLASEMFLTDCQSQQVSWVRFRDLNKLARQPTE